MAILRFPKSSRRCFRAVPSPALTSSAPWKSFTRWSTGPEALIAVPSENSRKQVPGMKTGDGEAGARDSMLRSEPYESSRKHRRARDMKHLAFVPASDQLLSLRTKDRKNVG